jgi:hypothetical protein
MFRPFQSACRTRPSLPPAAGLNHTRRRSVIPDTGGYITAVDAVRPETTGARSTWGAACQVAVPGRVAATAPGRDTVRDLL